VGRRKGKRKAAKRKKGKGIREVRLLSCCFSTWTQEKKKKRRKKGERGGKEEEKSVLLPLPFFSFPLARRSGRGRKKKGNWGRKPKGRERE